MLLKFGSVEREHLRLYRDCPPMDIPSCSRGIEYMESCIDRICLTEGEDEQQMQKDMTLLVEALTSLKVRVSELERLARQLYGLHQSLMKPLIRPYCY